MKESFFSSLYIHFESKHGEIRPITFHFMKSKILALLIKKHLLNNFRFWKSLIFFKSIDCLVSFFIFFHQESNNEIRNMKTCISELLEFIFKSPNSMNINKVRYVNIIRPLADTWMVYHLYKQLDVHFTSSFCIESPWEIRTV